MLRNENSKEDYYYILKDVVFISDISSYILAHYGLGGNIVDYSSHQRTDERFEKGEVWIRVIGNKPRMTANSLYQQLGCWFETEERNWIDTALNYARMKDRLKVMYTQEEMERILIKLESGDIKAEDTFLPSWLFGFTKQELINSLQEILLENIF